MKYTLTIDIGGTNTRVAIMDDKKQKVHSDKWSTLQDPIENFDKICSYVNESEYKVEAIGISAPGPADYENGVFGKLPNLPWENFKFIEYLKQKTQIENIVAQNDANLMALANHWDAKCNSDDVSLFFTLSTGIGAGIIINNKIFKGQFGNAAEVQYCPTSFTASDINKDNQVAGVEGFASGSGMEWLAKKNNIAQSTKELFEKYDSSKEAKAMIDNGIEALANLIATSVALINPGYVLFDGSIARYNPWYVERAVAIAKTRMPQVHTKFKVVMAKLGDDAALIGAYILTQK